MNPLENKCPETKKEPFPHLATALILRRGFLCLCSLLTWVAAATVLAPFALLADQRKSSPPSAGAGMKAEEPTHLELLYQQRAQRNPQDVEAFEGMAILQVRRGDYADAIACYRRVLELTPNDHDAKVGLGRALAFSGQYDAALRNFQGLLQVRPDDTDALEGIARLQTWAGHPQAALAIFQSLGTRYPANPEYTVGLARAQMNLHQYPQARKTLTDLLAAHPRNRDAQLQLAYLNLFEGHQTEALRRFNHLISQDPTDAEALLGNVRVAYYRGDLGYAHDLAAKIVDDDPRDAAALLLLAHLERARHRTRQARALVHRIETLAPQNADARELEKSLREESRPTLHTSISMAREASSGSPSSNEDLRTFGVENTWGLSLLPRSESYLSLAYLPSQSPSGGTAGAVAPSQLFYHQTTYLTSQLTLRAGVGLARFGPGGPVGIPTQELPITSAGTRPLGFGGVSYAWSRKLTVDFTAGRAAVTYTPLAVRLGVMENRLSLGVDYRFNAKTDLRLEPFETDDSSISYGHAIGLVGSILARYNKADHNLSRGASITFNRKLFHRPNLALDLGYAGLAYGISGGSLKAYLGFFNPDFYQRHYLTAHVVGKIRGPLGYDFYAGGGVQQVEHLTPLKPALLLSPAFTYKVSPRLALTLGYTHYDSSQSLGTLRGNALRLSTDSRF